MEVSGASMNEPIDFAKIQVLIVDDEKFIRGMTRRLLGVIGITSITEAADGAEGLSKLMDAPPDLVVLDIMMEPMNGLKFLKTVRIGLAGSRRDLPIIVLTGSNEQAVFGTAMALDCNAFMRKSDGPEVIKDRIVRVLGETVEVKESKAYQSVQVPDITITLPATSRPKEVAPASTTACKLPIEDIEAGVVVARDVVTEDGNTLLSAGSVLNASYLNRLRDISEIIELDFIWVEV
jgi:two-component system, chemotaxis family, chemotaxis protein CheY